METLARVPKLYSAGMGNVTQSGHGPLTQLTKAPPGTCVVCDDCGGVFTVSQEITSGTDKKKRCER